MQRHPLNPLITATGVRPTSPGWRVRGVFNPGATVLGDEILLLLRVAEDVPTGDKTVGVPLVRFQHGSSQTSILKIQREDPALQRKDTRGIVYQGTDYLSTLSHIRLARSRDGIHFSVADKPFLFPADATERFGVEDARVTRFGETYWINYTAISPDGWATALASTRDFETVERHGLIFHPENKDVSIFPEPIQGAYHALHRPNNHGFGRPAIWHATSPDLIHWGNHRCIARPRDTIWEEQKIGGGPPCVRTDQGWLQIYHAKGRDQIYSLWVLLLDLDEPWRVLKRSAEPFLSPGPSYEQGGFFPNVVFANGMIERGKRLMIYYGACDHSVCLLETTIEELLATLP